MTSPVSIFLLDTLRSLARDCSGVSRIESSLIIALVSIVVISSASDLGALLCSVFNNTTQAIQQTAHRCGPGNGNGNCGNRGNGGGNTSGSGPGTGNGGRGTGDRGAED